MLTWMLVGVGIVECVTLRMVWIRWRVAMYLSKDWQTRCESERDLSEKYRRAWQSSSRRVDDEICARIKSERQLEKYVAKLDKSERTVRHLEAELERVKQVIG